MTEKNERIQILEMIESGVITTSPPARVTASARSPSRLVPGACKINTLTGDIAALSRIRLHKVFDGET